MDTVLAEKLSALVQYQLPDFVRDNYETFQAFLVAYYEFLEQDGEAQYVLQNSENYKDIDDTIDSFVDMFLKQYAYDLPESIFLNQETKELLSTDTYESKRAIAKHLRQYYASKGSESGIKLLFRLLFDDDITFYYPKEDIFKPSSGVWTKRQTVKVINADSNSLPSGAVITGDISGAFGVVDKTYYTEKLSANANISILEVQFDKGSLQGSFAKGENVTIQYGNVTSGNLEVYDSGTLVNVVSSISIVTPGFGHKVNDVISIKSYNFQYKSTINNPNYVYTPDDDVYGYTVATGGKYVAISAPGENYSSGLYDERGIVYVYAGASGSQLYTLLSPSLPNDSNFGFSIAISDDYVVVGERQGGDYLAGNVHIYNAADGTYLRSVQNPEDGMSFFASYYGYSVALSGKFAVVGSPYAGDARGNAYILDLEAGSVIKTINDPNDYGTAAGDNFGKVVAMSQNYYAIAAPLEDQAGYSDTGRVYVYSGGSLLPGGSLLYKLSDPNRVDTPLYDTFGSALAISDQYLVVGAAGEYGGPAGPSTVNAGVAYVFETATGRLISTLVNPDGTAYSYFGSSVSIYGSFVIVGAAAVAGAAQGSGGESNSGKAYLFDASTGQLISSIENPNAYGTKTGDKFGWSVAMGDQYFVVGAPYEDEAGYTSSGKAYIYEPEIVNNFRAVVDKTTDTGIIKSISTENFGNGYDYFTASSITPASLSFTGKYKVTSNIATIVLFDSTGNSISHGLTNNAAVNVTFTSGITTGNGNYYVSSVISDKRFTIQSNVLYTSSGNITLKPVIATLSPTVGVLCEYPGTYETNRDGHVSDIKKIQDSDYYQDHSYVIRATKSSYLWKDIIKKTLHPAGLKLFSDIYISTANSVVAVSVEPPNGIYQTIVYLLKLLSTSVVNTLETVQPTTVVSLESLSRASRDIGSAYRIGPTFQTIDQFKYAYTNLHIYDLADYTLDFFANNINSPTIFPPPDDIYRGNANIILNSTFDDTSTWKLGSGLSITTGNLQGSTATASAWQPFTTAGNVKCMATYEIRRISAGSIALTTNTFTGTSRTTTGNYSEIFFAPHPNGNIILSATGFTGDVDNVYVKVLEPITN